MIETSIDNVMLDYFWSSSFDTQIQIQIKLEKITRESYQTVQKSDTGC